MLTLTHLDTFAAFCGDIDGGARCGGSLAMADGDWALIDEFLQGLHLVSAGLASPGFAAELEGRLLAQTQSEAVRERLRVLADKLGCPP